MISVKNLDKYYGKFKAIEDLSCTVEKGRIYGLVGSNGSGKSTFLRVLSGVFKSDNGEVKVDGEDVFDNPAAKRKFVYVSDELFFINGSTMAEMAKFYGASYPDFDLTRFKELSDAFGLNVNVPINTFSKGMKRQAATIIALSCKTDYIFLDETFDGLDPVMRNLVKKILYNDVCERNISAIITSHSLRELEDTCDKLALLHKGKLIFENDLDDIHTMLLKVQVAFDTEYEEDKFADIDVKSFTKSGRVSKLIVGGQTDKIIADIEEMNPILLEILPMTLDEIFIYELESRGYAFDNLFDKEI